MYFMSGKVVVRNLKRDTMDALDNNNTMPPRNRPPIDNNILVNEIEVIMCSICELNYINLFYLFDNAFIVCVHMVRSETIMTVYIGNE